MTGWLDRDFLSTPVIQALDLAAAEIGDAPAVDTRRLLLALIKTDDQGEWARIRLHFADEEQIRKAGYADPQPRPAQRWGAVTLSASCARALTVAVRLAKTYETGTVSPGLAAIGLIADPATAASLALTGGDRRSRSSARPRAQRRRRGRAGARRPRRPGTATRCPIRPDTSGPRWPPKPCSSPARSPPSPTASRSGGCSAPPR